MGWFGGTGAHPYISTINPCDRRKTRHDGPTTEVRKDAPKSREHPFTGFQDGVPKNVGHSGEQQDIENGTWKKLKTHNNTFWK